MTARLPAALVLACALLLPACGGQVSYEGVEDTTRTPEGRFERDIDDPDRQTVFGKGGVNALFDSTREDGAGGGLGVNAFLWRASLDTFAFLPLLSADPLGGVVVYDWYAPPDTRGERFKVTVYILDTRLRSDVLRVALNRQERAEDGAWYEAAVDPETTLALENAVLTRARQMRIAQLGQ